MLAHSTPELKSSDTNNTYEKPNLQHFSFKYVQIAQHETN